MNALLAQRPPLRYVTVRCGTVRARNRPTRKQVLVGSYPTEVQAAVAYDDAARKAYHIAAQATTATSAASTATANTNAGAADGGSPGAESAAAGAASAGGPPSNGNVDDAADVVTVPLDAATTPADASSAAGDAAAAAAPSAAKPAGPEPSYNFTSDREAQEQLDAIARFEAGIDVRILDADAVHGGDGGGGGGGDGSSEAESVSGVVEEEVDASLVVVVGPKGKLKLLGRGEKDETAAAAAAAGAGAGVGGGAVTKMEPKESGSSSPSAAAKEEGLEDGGGEGRPLVTATGGEGGGVSGEADGAPGRHGGGPGAGGGGISGGRGHREAKGNGYVSSFSLPLSSPLTGVDAVRGGKKRRVRVRSNRPVCRLCPHRERVLSWSVSVCRGVASSRIQYTGNPTRSIS